VSRALRGELWLIDLGMVAKTRPSLVLSVAYDDRERAVVSYVPRTTVLRGTHFEVPHTARGFDPGGFDAQGIAGVPSVQLIRRLGVLDGATLAQVETAVKAWLDLS
jgi:mRNA interferase MazF